VYTTWKPWAGVWKPWAKILSGIHENLRREYEILIFIADTHIYKFNNMKPTISFPIFTSLFFLSQNFPFINIFPYLVLFSFSLKISLSLLHHNRATSAPPSRRHCLVSFSHFFNHHSIQQWLVIPFNYLFIECKNTKIICIIDQKTIGINKIKYISLTDYYIICKVKCTFSPYKINGL
jgi:hypothetical protein